MTLNQTDRPTPRGPGARQRLQPLYHQIYVQMRRMLTETPQDPESALPAELELAKHYGVSRVTIRKTLEQLQRDGLIVRVHGKGTFPAGLGLRQDKVNISGALDNLLSLETRSNARTLDWSMVEVDARLAERMHSPRCLRIVRLRLLDGVPLSFTTLHVPERLASLLTDEKDRSEPLIQVLERKGIRTERAEQVLTAVPASARAAAELNVAEASPLMLMRRLMFDTEQSPILHQESCYPPDRFEYRMMLSRMSIGPVAQWTPVS